MRRKRIMFLIAAICMAYISHAQVTVQIGFGTQAPLTNNSIYSPICRFDASSGNDCSRSNLLYTEAELANVGITAGSTINKIAFYKIGSGASTAGFTFEIYMRNSTTTAPLSTATTWANILSTHTQVYATTTQEILSNPGWVEFTLTTPFVYTGQNLEIAMTHDMTAIAGNPTTGPFDWQYTDGFQDYIIGAVSSTLPANLNGTVVNYKVRPNIQFTYVSGVPCNGMPAGGTTTGTSPVCPGVNTTFSVTGSTSASGMSYQWQSSPDGFVWTDIPGQTNFSYTTTVQTPTNLRRMTVCNATQDTAYSSIFSVDVTPFLNCYCTSNATASTNSSIRNVTFANINNTSATACSQYTDYTTVQTVVNKGLTYPISVMTEDCEGTTFGTQRVAVFIDWNQNGVFTDPGELVWDPGTLPGAATVQFSGNITVPLTASTGLTKMRVINVQATTAINPCGTYTTGETEDYLIDVLPATNDEAGVLAITKPALAACSLGQELWVKLQNWGDDPLTSVNFSVNVNGVPISVGNPWTGNVPPYSEQEVQVPITYVFADGDSVTVEVSMPNGVVENPAYNFNNVTARRLYRGLSGNKTVYGPGADFANMNAALQALYLRGVCDTVYFNITPGSYSTQHVFNEYLNSGSGKLAVFQSATGNPSDVVYSFQAAAASDNYIFMMDGGDGYKFRNLTLKATGSSFSRVIDIRNGANDIIIENNILVGDTLATYSNTDVNKVVIASTNTTSDNRTIIRNNHIIGGNRGIDLGGSANYEQGNVIEGNMIEKYTYAGAYLSSSANYTVRGNTFRPKASLTQDAFGVYVNGGIIGGQITHNDIASDRSGSSIFLSNVKGAASKVLVANNFLYQGEAGVSTLSRGITIQDINTSGVLVANNSISVASNNPAGGAVTVVDGSGISFYNNNVGAFGDAPAVRVNMSYSVDASDFNNIYGTTISNIMGSAYTTLAAHQAASSMDAASVSVNPGFNGSDLHTCEPTLNAAGMALAQIVDDFDGTARSATPDIGADEFMGDANELLVEDEFLKCPSEQVTIGNTAMPGVTYSWSPVGNTSQITTSNAGIYIITATSSCGTYTDTAVVLNKALPAAAFTGMAVGLSAVLDNTSVNGTSYLWDFGDGNTSTSQHPTHTYAAPGTYNVILTVTNECGSSTYGPVQITAVNVGIEEHEQMEVNMFPNPTDGLFTISISKINGNAISVSVLDIAGKVLMVKEIADGTNQITIDATSFASGVYSVKITNGEISKVVRLVRK